MIKKIKAHIKEKEIRTVEINTPFIKLDSFLKMCNAVQTGGHAKIVISEGEVKVNGEVCFQRGKKLRDKDTAEYQHTIYEVSQKL